MFLLLPAFDLKEIPDTDAHETMDSLFDIKVGLIEDRYLHLSKDSNEPVYFLKAKSFVDVLEKEKNIYSKYFLSFEKRSRLSTEFLNKIEMGDQKKENEKKDLNEINQLQDNKSYIKKSRILDKNDYLISIRGKPIGYSLYRIEEIDQYHFVPSHYFIRLKPRNPNKFDIEYLHMLLDQLVDCKLVLDFEEIESNMKMQGKSYAQFNSFKLEELREIKFNYYSDINKQKETIQLYKKEYYKCQVAELKFQQLKEMIYQKISISKNEQ